MKKKRASSRRKIGGAKRKSTKRRSSMKKKKSSTRRRVGGAKRKSTLSKRRSTASKKKFSTKRRRGGSFFGDVWNDVRNVVHDVAPVVAPAIGIARALVGGANQTDLKRRQADVSRLKRRINENVREWTERVRNRLLDEHPEFDAKNKAHREWLSKQLAAFKKQILIDLKISEANGMIHGLNEFFNGYDDYRKNH